MKRVGLDVGQNSDISTFPSLLHLIQFDNVGSTTNNLQLIHVLQTKVGECINR